jgi:membrane protein implicated in regulation of membrane protease activity
MYIIAVAWIYVALLAAVSDTTVVGGLLTFLFYGVLPLALFLWLFGTPARHRRRRAQEADSSAQDGDNSAKNQ